MPRRDRKFMARMSLEGYVKKKSLKLTRLKKTPAQLAAHDVSQKSLFGLTAAGEGIIRVPIQIMERLGWSYGQRVYLSELPQGPIFAEAPCLMVEVER